MTDGTGNETWDADRYDDQCAFVYEYGDSVTDLLTIDPGARVLDLGCGTGQLSHRLAEREFDVVGLDASSEMIDRARTRHGEHERLEFVHGDARELETLSRFAPVDAVFSNAALHWIPSPDHDSVLSGVASVLADGGEFVAELGGRGNVARIVNACRAALDAHGYACETPWYFPSVGEYTPRLEAHGLEVRQAHLFNRPTELDNGEAGLREWLAMFGERLFEAVPETEMEAILTDVEDRARADLFEEGVWMADYRRLRFRAVLD